MLLMSGHSLFDMDFHPVSKMQSGLPVTSDSWALFQNLVSCLAVCCLHKLKLNITND